MLFIPDDMCLRQTGTQTAQRSPTTTFQLCDVDLWPYGPRRHTRVPQDHNGILASILLYLSCQNDTQTDGGYRYTGASLCRDNYHTHHAIEKASTSISTCLYTNSPLGARHMPFSTDPNSPWPSSISANKCIVNTSRDATQIYLWTAFIIIFLTKARSLLTHVFKITCKTILSEL